MNAYKLETTLSEDGSLTLEGLPFRSGVSVEVIVLEKSSLNHKDQPTTAKKSAVADLDTEYLSAVSSTMTEWESEADELAYHDL